MALSFGSVLISFFAIPSLTVRVRVHVVARQEDPRTRINVLLAAALEKAHATLRGQSCSRSLSDRMGPSSSQRTLTRLLPVKTLMHSIRCTLSQVPPAAAGHPDTQTIWRARCLRRGGTRITAWLYKAGVIKALAAAPAAYSERAPLSS